MDGFLPGDSPLTAAAAQVSPKVARKRQGRAVGFQDGMIAASVAAHGFSIATRDTAPFEAMGLTVTNPWE